MKLKLYREKICLQKDLGRVRASEIAGYGSGCSIVDGREFDFFRFRKKRHPTWCCIRKFTLRIRLV